MISGNVSSKLFAEWGSGALGLSIAEEWLRLHLSHLLVDEINGQIELAVGVSDHETCQKRMEILHTDTDQPIDYALAATLDVTQTDTFRAVAQLIENRHQATLILELRDVSNIYRIKLPEEVRAFDMLQHYFITVRNT